MHSKTLVFLHGFPLDHRMWSSQIEHFSDRGFPIVAPDMLSATAGSDTVAPLTMDQMADDLAQQLAAQGIEGPVTLCGLSMGGYVAFSFFRRYRQRVAALVLCDTRSSADAPEAAQQRLQIANQVLADGVDFTIEPMIEKLLCEDTIRRRPEIVEQMRQMMIDVGPEPFAAAARGMAARADSTTLLPNIDCPCLVVVGEHDVISSPEEMRQIAAAVPGARFEVIPAAGHMAPTEQPDAFNQILESFLSANQLDGDA